MSEAASHGPALSSHVLQQDTPSPPPGMEGLCLCECLCFVSDREPRSTHFTPRCLCEQSWGVGTGRGGGGRDAGPEHHASLSASSGRPGEGSRRDLNISDTRLQPFAFSSGERVSTKVSNNNLVQDMVHPLKSYFRCVASTGSWTQLLSDLTQDATTTQRE